MKKIMFNDRYGLTEAVLRGRKTQTRRMMKPKGVIAFRGVGYTRYEIIGEHLRAWNDEKHEFIVDKFPYKAGEIVAIAQSYKDAGYHISKYIGDKIHIAMANEEPTSVATAGWNNKMFVNAELMPRHIRITGIRFERLQDISDADCMKEGIIHKNVSALKPYVVSFGKVVVCLGSTPREAYAALIDKVSGKGTWASNPYVVVYDFSLVD